MRKLSQIIQNPKAAQDSVASSATFSASELQAVKAVVDTMAIQTSAIVEALPDSVAGKVSALVDSASVKSNVSEFVAASAILPSSSSEIGRIAKVQLASATSFLNTSSYYNINVVTMSVFSDWEYESALAISKASIGGSLFNRFLELGTDESTSTGAIGYKLLSVLTTMGATLEVLTIEKMNPTEVENLVQHLFKNLKGPFCSASYNYIDYLSSIYPNVVAAVMNKELANPALRDAFLKNSGRWSHRLFSKSRSMRTVAATIASRAALVGETLGRDIRYDPVVDVKTMNQALAIVEMAENELVALPQLKENLTSATKIWNGVKNVTTKSVNNVASFLKSIPAKTIRGLGPWLAGVDTLASLSYIIRHYVQVANIKLALPVIEGYEISGFHNYGSKTITAKDFTIFFEVIEPYLTIFDDLYGDDADVSTSLIAKKMFLASVKQGVHPLVYAKYWLSEYSANAEVNKVLTVATIGFYSRIAIYMGPSAATALAKKLLESTALKGVSNAALSGSGASGKSAASKLGSLLIKKGAGTVAATASIAFVIGSAYESYYSVTAAREMHNSMINWPSEGNVESPFTSDRDAFWKSVSNSGDLNSYQNSMWSAMKRETEDLFELSKDKVQRKS